MQMSLKRSIFVVIAILIVYSIIQTTISINHFQQIGTTQYQTIQYIYSEGRSLKTYLSDSLTDSANPNKIVLLRYAERYNMHAAYNGLSLKVSSFSLPLIRISREVSALTEMIDDDSIDKKVEMQINNIIKLINDFESILNIIVEESYSSNPHIMKLMYYRNLRYGSSFSNKISNHITEFMNKPL